jgi:hypothetical protein
VKAHHSFDEKAWLSSCPITLANLVQITPSFVMNLLFYGLFSFDFSCFVPHKLQLA